MTACVPGAGPGPGTAIRVCQSVGLDQHRGERDTVTCLSLPPCPSQQPGESITDNIGAKHEKRQSQSLKISLCHVIRCQIGRIRVPSLLRDEIFSCVLTRPVSPPRHRTGLGVGGWVPGQRNVREMVTTPRITAAEQDRKTADSRERTRAKLCK